MPSIADLEMAKANAELERMRAQQEKQGFMHQVLLAAKDALVMCLAVVVGVALIVSCCIWIGPSTPPPKTTADKLHSWTRTTKDCYGYQYASDYDRASEIATSGDSAAFQEFWQRRLLSGTATIIASGTKIYLEEIAHFSKRARVRPEGSTSSYWVPLSAL